jgi:S1-C subfamily serine protease
MWAEVGITLWSLGPGAVAPKRADPALEQLRAATVLIEANGPGGRSVGSGFLVADGALATAAHVVQGTWMGRITLSSGQILPIEGVRAIVPELDLAILAVPSMDVRPVRIGDARSLRIGQRLFAIGCPLGLGVSVSDGVLSATPVRADRSMLQISIPVSPGSSGGPIATESGEVVGLVVSGVRTEGAENLNFALPAGYLAAQLDSALAATPMSLAEVAGKAPIGTALAFSEGMSNKPLPPVNRSVGVSYARIGGVEVLDQWSRPDGVRISSLMKVDVAFTATGDTVVDRVRTTTLTQGGPLGQEEHRTLFTVGDTNSFGAAVRYRPADERTREYGSVLQVRGSQFVVTDLAGAQNSGIAPPRVLPVSLADLALASVKGELPATIEFTVLDPTAGRLLAARYRFVETRKIKIPVAKPGTTCDQEKPDVERRTVEVRVGVRELGVDRSPVMALARAPYVVVDQHLRCIVLPA